jgi:hypothetical protein
MLHNIPGAAGGCYTVSTCDVSAISVFEEASEGRSA